MKTKFLAILACLAGLAMATLPVHAALVMPSFADVPTGWTTDRYEPASFSNVGTYQGRSDVLGIGISAADGFTNRPAPYQSTFYNTQGRQHAISGGVGDVLSASLYIPEEWRSGQGGNVRTDMWGVMTDGTDVSDYTIIGFTNYGGNARLRVWDNVAWVDLVLAISFDDWTDFAIDFTGSAYEYRVNGNLVYTDSTINGTTGYMATIMQAYNFCGDPSLGDAVCKDYTAHWSNAQAATVPTPASLSLAMLALLALGGATVRSRRNLAQ